MLAARKARKESATTSAKKAAAAAAAVPGAVPSAAAAAGAGGGGAGAAGRSAAAAAGTGGAGGASQGGRAGRGWGTKILGASAAGLAVLGIAWQLKPDEVRKLLDDSPIDHFAIWVMSKYSLVRAELFLGEIFSVLLVYPYVRLWGFVILFCALVSVSCCRFFIIIF